MYIRRDGSSVVSCYITLYITLTNVAKMARNTIIVI